MAIEFVAAARFRLCRPATNCDGPAPGQTKAPAVRALFARAGSSLALTRPGGRFPDRCCSTILNRDEWPPLGTDERSQRDLLILLPVESSERVTDLYIQANGEKGLVGKADPKTVA